MKIHCESCDSLWPKSRHYFPWGSKKPKICKACIEARFFHILEELDLLDLNYVRDEIGTVDE